MATFIQLIKIVLLVVNVLLWSAIGLFFWIPLLVRSTAVFSAAILSSAMAGSRPDGAVHTLHTAIEFYPKGFSLIFESLFARKASGNVTVQLHFWKLLLELLWASFVWIVSVLAITGDLMVWLVFLSRKIAEFI